MESMKAKLMDIKYVVESGYAEELNIDAAIPDRYVPEWYICGWYALDVIDNLRIIGWVD